MSTPAAVARPAATRTLDRRNILTFGPGTLGRDLAYTLVTMYLGFYLTDVLDQPDDVVWWTNAIMLGSRLLDGVLDFVMGAVVDNTRSRWGRYKPWILVGIVASALLTVALFSDMGLAGGAYVAVFGVVYLLWGISWTINDISYWSLLPALSVDPHVRERIGSVAKLFGTVGLFAVVIVVPMLGDDPATWQATAIGLAVAMVALQAVTLVGVREPRREVDDEAGGGQTPLRDIAGTILRNDQLVWTAVSMVLFFTGYQMTTSAGIYFFKYVYRDEAMYSVFGAVLGLANLVGYGTFPLLAKRVPRRRFFTWSVAALVVGYALFALGPVQIVWLSVAAFPMFVTGAWILMICMVSLADTVEYGHWKLGRRNVSLTFAVQPFVFKVSSALSSALILATVVLAGINSAATPDDVPASGLVALRVAMLAVPVMLILLAWALHHRFYRIDAGLHARIVAELRERGELD